MWKLLTISDRFVDRDIFMRYLGLGIGHTIVGEATNSTDDAHEEEVELAETRLPDVQHDDDWGNQGGEQEDQTFEQDMDDEEDEDEEAADLDGDEDEEETNELEDSEEGDGDYSDGDLGYDDL